MIRPSPVAGLILASLAAGAAAQAPGQTQANVSFPSTDGALTNGAPTLLSGLYRTPATPGPWPLVIGLHGCGGLWNAAGDLDRRSRDWADRLTAQGYAVLYPDSFTPRGHRQVCTIPTGQRTVRSGRERPHDVWGAVRWAQANPDIRPGKIALIGWSHGGSTVLYSIWPGSRAWASAPPIRPVTAIAFYPGCRAPLNESRGWSAGLPLTILIGEEDDWTPANWCQDLAAQEEVAERPMTLVTYPGAVHGFDAPDSPRRQRSGLNTPTGTAWVGTDPAARADAIRRVDAILAKAFGK